MTTREENFTKINGALEMLSDVELEQVAGGNGGETLDDSVFLYERGLTGDYHRDPIALAFNWNSYSAEVDAGWKKAGITCVTKPFDGNDYFFNGNEISRDEAYEIVKSKYPKIREA